MVSWGFQQQLKQAKVLASIHAGSEGVISVFKSETLNLHTIRRWDFVGLNIDYVEKSPVSCGSDVIVGIIDSGIWPESPSFREEPGMGLVPKSLKRKCVGGESFNAARACNRKLIGAKYYIAGFESNYGALNKTGHKEYRSPYDVVGHGTHTCSVVRAGARKGRRNMGEGEKEKREGKECKSQEIKRWRTKLKCKREELD